MFQQVRGGDRSQLTSSGGEDVTVITQKDLVETTLMREGYLLGADVDTHGVVSLREQQANQLALSTANVKDRSRM
jgi:hypothetical protein